MKPTSTKYVLGCVAAALIAVFFVASRWYQPESAGGETGSGAGTVATASLVAAHSPVLGPADAPVTIVEFLDPECEACAAMHPHVKNVLNEFAGKIRLVVRYMPLHGNSVYAASLLEGARPQQRYWQVMDEFFRRQPEWANHSYPRPELLITYARDLGVDERALLEIGRSAETVRRIEQDKADGLAIGVRQTPTFFVNGRKLQQLGPEPLRAAVREALGSR